MPEIITTTVYRFDELSDAAKKKARAWYRENCFNDDWFEFVHDDFERICSIIGLTLKTHPVRLIGGGSRQKPCIWFSGFWNQGDGACFEGHYRYARSASRALRAYAPLDAELHRIADALLAVQRRNFHQLHAVITHRGRHCHEQSMAISVHRDSPTGQDMTADAEATVIEALRDLARWLYRQLERDYEDRTSDEAVDEAIIANDHTFTENGQRFG